MLRLPLPLLIAFRYFWAKKSTNAITILSWISLLAVAFGVAALVIVLSVFNGFESLVKTLYHSFNSDLLLTPTSGKVMLIDSIQLQRIKNIKGVEACSGTLEENALIRYQDKQFIATIQGVDTSFQLVNDINKNMYQGIFSVKDSGWNIVLGAGIAQALEINPEMSLEPVQLFSASRSANLNQFDLNPENSFHRQSLYCMGVFAIQQDFDIKYAFIDIQLARTLFEQPTGYSYLNLKLKANASESDVRKELQTLLGNSTIVKNRFEQNSFIYRIMQIEKWVVFALLGFILLIASFNFVGSLSLIAVDKEKDLGVLLSLGATPNLLKTIFILIGYIMIGLGTLIGLIIGTAVCLGQQYFEWIHLQGTSFVINTYPVDIHLMDDLYIIAIVMVIGFVASLIPARKVASFQPNLKSR
jgi:lipoprotein-releasing system permease protein